MSMRILVVEDDQNDVFFLGEAVKKAGILIPLHVAVDGQQAVDYMAGNGKYADRVTYPLPCLVLLDLKLPYVMGLDVLKWIRQSPNLLIPVIILSASKNESDIQAAYRLGANAYMVKPNAVSKLHDMVRAVKEFWLTHNVPYPGIGKESTERIPQPHRKESSAN